MTETFDNKFMDLQFAMVSVAVEFVNKKADKAFVYGSIEEGVVTGDVFYQVGKRIFKKHELSKLNDFSNINMGDEMQYRMLGLFSEDLQSLMKLFKEDNREVPTEFKMIYDINSGKFNSNLSYDLKYSDSDYKDASDIFDKWFDEVKKEIEG
ncbi:hypothetical protein ACYSNR_11530 [Enterococcus sp. LJL128]|uniref:hypothetical protein n=1 Tax=Enterococcus sp. LJL51 TaxID=3416656 RepID=UPI003CF2C749